MIKSPYFMTLDDFNTLSPRESCEILIEVLEQASNGLRDLEDRAAYFDKWIEDGIITQQDAIKMYFAIEDRVVIKQNVSRLRDVCKKLLKE